GAGRRVGGVDRGLDRAVRAAGAAADREDRGLGAGGERGGEHGAEETWQSRVHGDLREGSEGRVGKTCGCVVAAARLAAAAAVERRTPFATRRACRRWAGQDGTSRHALSRATEASVPGSG